MSEYITPDKVISPRRNWRLIRVLEDGAQYDSEKQHVAIAIGTWDNDPVLAMRWNGRKGHPIGNPQSRGLPTWFVIPKRLHTAVIETLSRDNQVLVRMLLKDPKQ